MSASCELVACASRKERQVEIQLIEGKPLDATKDMVGLPRDLELARLKEVIAHLNALLEIDGVNSRDARNTLV